MRFIVGFLFYFNLVLATAGSLPLSFLETIHTQVLQDPDFNKTYIKSGCYVRAHWIAKMIFDTNHVPLKVFVLTPSHKEKMSVKLPSGETAKWIFHVTAGYKDFDGKIWLIDPILFSAPITMQTWVDFMQNQNPEIKLTVKITGPEVYHIDDEANAEFKSYGKTPFSERSMSYIRDSMNVLYFWESFKD